MTSDAELNPESAVTVGRITAAHGIRGEIKVESLTDFPSRFEPGSRLWLEGASYEVERGRWQGRSVLLKLSGIETRSQAEMLAGKELLASEAMPIEDEDVYYLHDVIGLQVEDASGELLGKLADVLSTGSNDVYVVRGERGELLLPALDDVVRKVDLAGGRIVVEIPDGIDFVKPAMPRSRPRRSAPKP